MGPDDFRRIALGMADAVEGAHMGHPDFRVLPSGRIFATLHGDHRSGMVKLTPDQQRTFMQEFPAAFAPESGAWGRAGCTAVRLDSVDEDALGDAMTHAWQNTVTLPAPRRSSAKPRKSARAGKSRAKTTAPAKAPRRAPQAIRTSRKR